MARPFKRILIANRGEIACRIIRACRDEGVEAVAVYSGADAHALHASLADIAVPIGPAPPAESYLSIARLVAAAKETGCEAVHPGYGFLSERAAFAEAVRDAGLAFIGPAPEAIAAMGSKVAARELAERAGVPVLPAFDGEGDDAGLAEAARQIGYPLLVKASGGGGGKGMRRVHSPAELADALAAARREAQAAFGDARVYLEKLLVAPRHVEVQVFGDSHGNIVHLFERDCSVQRRHQKVVEESPAPHLPPATRAAMGEAAVRAARAVGYVGAGTVEFLLDADGRFFFLEMNTRLQVEHPVSELVVGVDLVRLQLRVAAGEPLPFAQPDLAQRGHAIECRVYAEDVEAGFLPSTGPLLRLEEPQGPGVRVDSGVRVGDVVSRHYDPLLAKLICWGATRDAALATLRRALREYAVLGVTTNLAFLQAIVGHPAFVAGRATTAFLDEQLAGWAQPSEIPDEALVAAALADLLAAPATPPPGAAEGDPYSPWRSFAALSPQPSVLSTQHSALNPQPSALSGLAVRVEPEGDGYRVAVGERGYRVNVRHAHEGTLTLEIDGRQRRAVVAADAQRSLVALDGATYAIERAVGRRGRARAATSEGALTAAMPGQVLAVYAAAGDAVEAGQPLVLLSAMKMELTVAAPHAGTVAALHVAPGDVVERGQVLAQVEPKCGSA
jgi:3-methylcrotonyl-CoA carboxylase alpha subunit